jgi:hypothetical protein
MVEYPGSPPRHTARRLAVAFCAGDDSGFITGITAPVDGGLAVD